ncbi:MAG: hypothetical protein LQ341_006904 [Variospora aurantia]|nr:MAG: hypothetical protein LQ341_006904 [Variospora aurantia]
MQQQRIQHKTSMHDRDAMNNARTWGPLFEPSSLNRSIELDRTDGLSLDISSFFRTVNLLSLGPKSHEVNKLPD